MTRLMNKVVAVKKIAKQNDMDSLVTWCKQAEYMIKTYGNTEHADTVRKDVERMLKRIGAM